MAVTQIATFAITMLSRRYLLLPKTTASFLLIFLISFTAHSEQRGSHERLGFWRAIEPFGAEQALNKQQQAFYEVGRYFELMDNWRRAMYAPINEKPLWTQFRQDIQDHDRNDFFSSTSPYFSETNAGYSCLSFEGSWQHKLQTNAHYDIAISNPNPESKTSKQTLETFGDLQGKITFLPGSLKPNNVLSDINISLNLGTLLFTEILESIETMNRAFQADRLEQYQQEHNVSASIDDINQPVSAIDKALLAHFLASLPNSMQTLLSISKFEKFVVLDTRPSGEAATRINHRQRINLTALKQKFHATYDDFKDLLNGLSFNSEIRTKDNKVLARFAYDADEKLVSADMVFADGGFVLQSLEGELLEQIIFPTQLQKLGYKIVNTMKVSLLGLKVTVNELTIEADYDAGLGTPRTDRSAKISMAMASMPAIDVSGAFLYIIPFWLIDLFIPGTIETLIADSFEDLVAGNHGEGLTLDLFFDEHDNQHTLTLAAKAELPYKVIQELVKIEDDKEHTQQARLYRKMRDDLRRDFASKAAIFNDPRLGTYLNTLHLE